MTLLEKGITIYYFSGTGNAKNVAHWIGACYEDLNICKQIIDISKLDNRCIKQAPETDTIGFVSPTHGFNFPPIMLHFIFRFPRSKGQKVFLLNTRAGMKMGKLFLPGLSGITLWLSTFILLLKGYKICSLRSFDLPSNWISLHPGLKDNVIDSIYKHRKQQVERFSKNLIKGKGSFLAFRGLIPDILIAPVAVLYYFIGRFFLAKTFYASSQCNKCGLCVKHCPIKAIKWVDNRPFWKATCESCMRCMNSCPQRAIETAHGLATLMAILFYGILLQLIPFNEFKAFLNDHLPEILGSFMSSIISGGLFLLLMFIVYYIIHFAMRIKFIEKFIVYTSLTHIKSWGRYKIPKS